jgi:hypothetical protein
MPSMTFASSETLVLVSFFLDQCSDHEDNYYLYLWLTHDWLMHDVDDLLSRISSRTTQNFYCCSIPTVIDKSRYTVCTHPFINWILKESAQQSISSSRPRWMGIMTGIQHCIHNQLGSAVLAESLYSVEAGHLRSPVSAISKRDTTVHGALQ